jgi:predicted transcriptional regulator
MMNVFQLNKFIKIIFRELNRGMSLKVYVDVLSQPSRAVLILLKITKIPFEFIETRIA